MVYTIGEVAKKLNVSPSALRYYDKEGLFPFIERSESGIRMFRDEDFAWLEIIDCLKKTGMPIKDIKNFVDASIEGDATIDERGIIINNQRDAVIEQIKQLQEMLKVLNYKSWYYETAKKVGTCAFRGKINREDIPKEFISFVDKYK